MTTKQTVTKAQRDAHVDEIIRTMTRTQQQLSLEFLMQTALTAPNHRIRKHALSLAYGKKRIEQRTLAIA